MRERSGEEAFLVFSDDWGEHPSSCQHLFRRISKDHRTLWVNTIGMRNPGLTRRDIRKASGKISRMLKGTGNGGKPRPSRDGVRVLQPPMLPFGNLDLVRLVNRLSVTREVRRESAGLGLDRPVLVATVPNACDYVGRCGESRVIYYCVDDFARWPGLNAEAVRGMEEELIRRSDLFIATSHKLFNRLSRYGKPTFLLEHGVDLEHFGRSGRREHPLLAGIPKPRVGYCGLFDERSDLGLLAEVIRRMPDASFVITGRVEVDAAPLEAFPNAHFTGSVSYDELPQMMEGFDVLILPYAVNELTESISPLKLKEYLATGKPVVGAPIPEVLGLSEFVAAARTPDEWERELRSSLAGARRDAGEKVRGFLENESWERKAEEFLGYAGL